MPGPWFSGPGNPEFLSELSFEEGDLWEAQVRDDTGDSQGTVLLEVQRKGASRGGKSWFQARVWSASDEYLRWWLSNDSKAAKRDDFKFHVCGVASSTCRENQGSPDLEFHTDCLRHISQGDVTESKIAWLAKPEQQAAVGELVKRWEAGGGCAKRDGLPRVAWPWSSTPSG